MSKGGDLSVEEWGECNGYCPGEYTGGDTTTSTSTASTASSSTSPSGPTTEPPPPPEPGSCGLRPPTGERIIGGSEAGENSWPWQVSVQVVDGSTGSSRHVCGGSIFNYEYVITAAHCVIKYSDQPESLVVVAGEHSLSQENAADQRLTVGEIFTREDYDGHDYVNDIALLHLSSFITFDNQTTNYICLPVQGDDYSKNDPAVIIGWGYTSEDGDSFSDVLQEAEVTTMTDTDCRNTNYNPDFIYDQHLCAGAPGVDGCVGDAGGTVLYCTVLPVLYCTTLQVL